MTTLGPGEEATFPVDARKLCNSSGLQLEAGKRYAFKMTQIHEAWKDAWVKSSPSKGWEGIWGWFGGIFRPWARARDLPMYALVGVIDEDPETLFLIGEKSEHAPTRTGQLQAFANDWPGRYSNNKGRCTVAVRRVE